MRIQQSGPADVDGSTPAQINHGNGARTGCHTRSGPLADKLLRSRPSSHVDARRSTIKILGPGPNAGHALALRPSATNSFLKKVFFFPPFLPYLVFFSSAPSLRCTFCFSFALLILPICQKIHFMHAVKVVTCDGGQRTAHALTGTSRPIDQDVDASRNFDDFHGAISCWIIANKLF